jgi:hypothetical protein
MPNKLEKRHAQKQVEFHGSPKKSTTEHRSKNLLSQLFQKNLNNSPKISTGNKNYYEN